MKPTVSVEELAKSMCLHLAKAGPVPAYAENLIARLLRRAFQDGFAQGRASASRPEPCPECARLRAELDRVFDGRGRFDGGD